MFKNICFHSEHIKDVISPLKSISHMDIIQPKTIEEGRNNLKRYYGCIDNNLVVLLHNYDRLERRINLSEGQRVDGSWIDIEGNTKIKGPHPAVNKLISFDDYSLAHIDIEKMDSLADLYEITGSGMFNGTYDPSFTLNLIENPEDPLVEENVKYSADLMMFLRERQDRVNGKYLNDAWLNDATAYGLYANDDPYLKRFGGFYSYSLEKGFNWRWRQMNNRHTRYLHWLLLGSFAPYHYSKSGETIAA